MNNKDPLLTMGLSPLNGASGHAAGSKTNETVNGSQEAHVSSLEARMAQAAEGRRPVEMRKKAGIGDNRWVIGIALWAPLVFMLILVFLAFRGQRLRDTDARWVLHTVQVKDRVDRLHDLIENVETSERGYLLTGDTSYLEVYEKALKEIPSENQNLAFIIADNPKQVAAAALLHALIADKLSIAAQSVALAELGHDAEAIQLVKSGRDKELMDEVRSQVDAMEAEEDRLLPLRESALASQVKTQEYEMTGLVAVEVVLIVGLILLMQRLRKAQFMVDERVEEANVMTDQAQEITMHAMARTEQAEVRAADADTRTEEAETRGEEGVRSSELRYRRLFETAQDGIIVLDASNGQVVDANPYMQNLLGYSQEEMCGQKLWEIGPFKESAGPKIAFTNLVQSGRIQNENLSLETKDGRQIQVEFMSNAYRMDGNLLVQCNIRDITERKKAEQDLILLRTCIAHLNDIVLITEADSTEEPGPRIVFVNEAFERMTGYTYDETLGRSPRFLQGPKTDRRMLDEIHEAVAQRKPIRRQIINYRKDGTEFWLDIDIVPILDAAGRCTHFAGIERDITGEKKIRESLDLFRTLMDRSPDAIEVVDATTGRFLHVNATACQRLGYSHEEMLGLTIPDIIVAEDTPFSMEANVRDIRKTGVRIIETRHRRKDGSTFPSEVNTQYIDLDQGYLVAVVRDITERKQADEARRATEERYRTLFETSNDAIAIIHNGVFVDCNARTIELFGLTREQLIGQSPSFVSPPTQPDGRDSGEKAIGLLQQTLAGKPQLFEWLHLGVDGHVIDTDISLTRFELRGEAYVQAIVRDVTKRKQTEEARRRTEERYRTLFDYAPDGILIVSTENVYIDANASICEMLGYTRDELIGRTVPEIVAETDFERIEPALSTIRSQTNHHREWKFRRKNGSVLEVDAFSTLMPDGNVLAMIRDITDRKRNEARFRRLVESNAQSVLFWNTKGEITGANDAFLHLVRYTREDLESGRMDWKAMTPSEYNHLDLHSLKQIADKGVGSPYEKEFIRKDGVRVSVLIGATSFEDNSEEGVAFVLDLTERECAAEQIAEQAALLDEAQDAIIVRNLEGKVIFWNKGAERMYGWTRQEVLGLNVSKLLFRDPKKFAEVNALTIKDGKWSGDLQHLTKDKKEITVEARWTLIRDVEGQPKSVLAINTDVTEKKKIEAQFLRAQRMDSIGTLAGGVAHDLNNILQPILMSIELLQETASDPESMNFLRTIELSAKRGADIVKQVLSFARGVEGERVEIQPKNLLKDLESIIKNTFPKNIRLQFSIPDDTWMILGDSTQVHQVLLNLCVNARDAMPNGGELSMGVENCELDEQYAAMNLQAKAGRYVSINVTDSGTGIPQAILDKIFEPFFTTKEINEGTGLGLSTVMGIVKSHGGIINVYSEPGKGTTFKVYLPAMELSSAAQRQLTQQIMVPRGNGEMVLLIDDEDSILTITGRTLEAFGYRVLTAIDGAEAVAVFAENKNKIAVVLTDMSMPIMDGAAVIRALTKINPEIKIIAASGLSAKGDVAKVSGLAVKHFLTKPYTAGTLLKLMRVILDET